MHNFSLSQGQQR
uniref:Uncharacterized protein n=1 Tax=Arundo donax TaxID=35708 RepID=A0A0A8Z4L8_ARUDO